MVEAEESLSTNSLASLRLTHLTGASAAQVDDTDTCDQPGLMRVQPEVSPLLPMSSSVRDGGEGSEKGDGRRKTQSVGGSAQAAAHRANEPAWRPPAGAGDGADLLSLRRPGPPHFDTTGRNFACCTCSGLSRHCIRADIRSGQSDMTLQRGHRSAPSHRLFSQAPTAYLGLRMAWEKR